MDWTATVPDRVPVLVPRRADGGARDQIWDTLRDRVWRFTNVVEGHHDVVGPFNRSAALNKAASLADAQRPWNLAIVADADSFAPPAQLAGALHLAETTGRLVIAHSRWVNVDVDETTQFLDEGWLEHRDTRVAYSFTVSSLLVVPRPVWDAVHGFDENFTGWGREDNAFMRAVKVIAGAPLRMDGTVYHLAHDRPTEDTSRHRSPLYQANERRWRTYQGARTVDAMRALVAGNRETFELNRKVIAHELSNPRFEVVADRFKPISLPRNTQTQPR